MVNVLIWGTGKIAEDFVSSIANVDMIVGFVQSIPTSDSFLKKRVYSPKEVPRDFEYIIVANSFSDKVYDTCIKYDLDLKKVVFLIRGNKTNFNSSVELREFMGEKNYTNYLAEYGKIEDSFFYNDLDKYNSLNQCENFKAAKENLWPIISDKYTVNSGQSNYFWQDLWAATKIIRSGVKLHYDIGSRVDGFIGHLLAAGIRVNMIDIREIPVEHELLETVIADATNMEHIPDNSLESLSALCSLEHFGLGRYGDEIDPEACFKAFNSICKKMKKGGNLYIAVPVGRERVDFNAHRVFFANTIVECFGAMELLEYSCAACNHIEKNVAIDKYDNDPHNGEYRYGLFHFRKM